MIPLSLYILHFHSCKQQFTKTNSKYICSVILTDSLLTNSYWKIIFEYQNM